MANDQKYGDESLVEQARNLCMEIEKLPPGAHQTTLISHASQVFYALHSLQETGEYFWPRQEMPPCHHCGGVIKVAQGGICMPCCGENS